MLSTLSKILVESAQILAECHVPFAIVGGIAVTIRAYERTTKDVDVAVVLPTLADEDALIRAFLSRGFITESVLENKRTGLLSTVRLTRDDLGGFLLDILISTSGIELEVVQDASLIEVLPGVILPVASISSLIAMKVLSANPDTRMTDYADLRALSNEATSSDFERAKELLQLITERGGARGKDLLGLLGESLAKLK